MLSSTPFSPIGKKMINKGSRATNYSVPAPQQEAIKKWEFHSLPANGDYHFQAAKLVALLLQGNTFKKPGRTIK